MRILLSLIFALAGFSAFSQTYPPMTMGSKLYEFKNGARFDSAAFLPRRDTTNADATMLAPGMLQWRPADQSFYGRDSIGWRRFVLEGTLSGYVTVTRSINTTSPLSGGGNLSADRTISIANAQADGENKGAATFRSDHFDDDGMGAISLDTVNWPAYTKNQSDLRYVYNGVSPQKANFNITGNGNIQNILTAGTIFSNNLFSSLDTIYFFGNSITLGSGASPSSNRYSTVVSSALGNSQRNYGIGSSTLQKSTPEHPLGARDMIDTLDGIPIKTSRGRIISFAYGLNDMGCNQPDYDTINFKRDYRRVLDTCAARGWSMQSIIIISPTWVTDSAYGLYATLNSGQGRPTRQRHLDFVAASRDIAQERGTMFIDMYHAMKSYSNPALLISADSLHPNNTGHAFMADTISKYLKKSFSGISNRSLYVDSSVVLTNTNIILNNSASTIINSANNFVIANNTIAATRELALISDAFNYSTLNYWGWHAIASVDGNVYLQTIGKGAERARSLIIGKSNDNEGTTDFVKIDSTGNVAIGTNTTSTAKLIINGTGKALGGLHVVQDGSASILSSLRLSNTAETRGANLQLDAATNPGLNLWIHNGTSYTNRMTWDATGNVGIGTTGPRSKLDINGYIIIGPSGSENISARFNGIAFNRDITNGTIFSSSGHAYQFAHTASTTNTSDFLSLSVFNTAGSSVKSSALTINGNGDVGVGRSDQLSTFDISGSIGHTITTVTGNTTLDASHSTVLVNNTGSVTITLPAASSVSRRIYVIKKISAASNDVVIDGNASETIDAATTKTLTLQYSSVTIQSNGTNWFILSSHAAATVL